MHAAIAVPGDSHTILTHLFGHGLEDDRYVVERFQALTGGEIRLRPADAPAKKGKTGTRRRPTGPARCPTGKRRCNGRCAGSS